MATTRNIVTKFYFRREERKINRSAYADKAVLHCIEHLQKNSYRASIAEIFNETTGQLIAVITRNINGVIKIHYKNDEVFVKSLTE